MGPGTSMTPGCDPAVPEPRGPESHGLEPQGPRSPDPGPRRTGSVTRTIAGAAGAIAVLTLLSRVIGFGRYLVFADAVRSGGVGGVYNAVNAIPNVFYEVAAGGVLAAVAVPLIGAAIGAGRAEQAHRIASVLLTWTLLGLVPLALLVLLTAPWLAAFVVPDGLPAAQQVGSRLLRIFAVQIPLYGVGIVLSGLLQAHRRFLAVALAPLLSSLTVIATYLVYGALTDGRTDPGAVPGEAITVLGWGTTLGVVALSLPLLGPALATGWRPTPALRLGDGIGRRLGQLALAGLVALAAQQLATVAVMRLSRATGDPGTFTVYGYAQAVYVLPYAVLAVPIATSVFPSLAQSTGANLDVAPLVSRALKAVLALTGVAAGVLMAVAAPIGSFFTALDARRGSAPSTEALAALPTALVAYAPGLVGFAAVAVLTRALYVRGSAPAAGAAVAGGWLVAAVVPFALVGDQPTPEVTLRALGIGSTIGMTVAALTLGLLVRRAWGPPALAGVNRSAAVVVVAMSVALLVGDLVSRLVGGHGVWGALVSGIVGGSAAVVAGLAVVMIGDRDTVAAAIRRGRSRRRREP